MAQGQSYDDLRWAADHGFDCYSPMGMIGQLLTATRLSMADRKKRCTWILLGFAGVCIALCVLFLLFLPRILNLEQVKSRMKTLASEQLGGRVEYEKIESSFLPRPRIVIRQGTFLKPGEMEVSLEKLKAETSLLSLLKGNFALARIRVEAPRLKLEFSGEAGGDSGLSVEEEVRKEVDSVVSALTSKVPGLSVEFEEGTVELFRKGQLVFRTEGLRARFDSRPDRVQVDLSCRSKFWNLLSLTGSIGATLKGKCQIRLRGFECAPILEKRLPSTLTGLEAADLDVQVAFDGQVADVFEAEFSGSLPSLRKKAPNAKQILEALEINGVFTLEGGRMNVSLNRLILGYPRLKARGDFSIDSDPPKVSLEAKGEAIGLLDLREVALMTGGEYPLVRQVWEFVRGGEISSLVFRSQGTTFSDLGSLVNLSVQGRFKEAGIVVPDPDLELKGVGGEIALSAGLLEGRDLKGHWGKSSFSGTTVRLDLHKPLYVQHLSGDFILSLNEIHQRLALLGEFREATQGLKKVKGTAVLSIRNLSGPLEKPEKWRFETGGTLKGMLLETDILPGRVKVSRGSFRADRDSIFLEGLRVNFLDAECVVVGRLDGYRAGLRAMEWRLSGNVGPEVNRWASEKIELPGEYRLKAPYGISSAVCKWEKGNDTLLRATLVSPRGPRIVADFVLKPETVVVNELSIEDEQSKASVGLKETENAFFVAFQGSLEKATLDKLLLDNKILAGSIEGDLETNLRLDRPMESKAHGTLRAEGLSLPLPIRVPVVLEDMSLRAQDKRIRAELARFTWEGEEFVLEGDALFSSEGFLLDMVVLAGDLEWDKIEKALRDEEETEGTLSGEDARNGTGLGLPIQGTVRVNPDSFTFEGFTWRPVAAEILIQKKGLEVHRVQANLCGISTGGTAKVSPKHLSFDLEISCQDKKIEKILDCLQIDEDATGDLDFIARLNAKGQAEELLRSLQGEFELSCRKGTILRDPAISAILAFVNTTEVLRGRLPDFQTQGFPYNTIRAHGVIQNGKVKLEEVLIDGTTVDIYSVGEVDLVEETLNVRVLVSSLQTVEFIVSKIPLVSYLLGGGGITAIPVRVRGPLDNPTTVPLSPTALGEDLLGIMGRTLSLPYKAIEFVLPKRGKQVEEQP